MRSSSTRTTTPRPVARATEREGIEIAPNVLLRTIAAPPAERAIAVGVCYMQAVGNGTFRPVLRLHACFVAFGDAAKHFGIPAGVLRCLVTSGLVKGREIAPHKWQAEAESLSAHLRACERDPKFWSRSRREQFEGTQPAIGNPR